MIYFIKTPWVLRKLYPTCIWSMPVRNKEIYLTFDDGPHPTITPIVLEELKKYQAKATFFCLGKNVKAYPEVYQRIIEEGHAVGNHSFNHLDGWKTNDKIYLADIAEAASYIDSNLFRPPYGRITGFQVKQLAAVAYKLKIIMWTVLSGDFDKKISPQQCMENVILNGNVGSIIVFHDSEKAFDRLSIALPAVLSYFKKEGFTFDKISGS